MVLSIARCASPTALSSLSSQSEGRARDSYCLSLPQASEALQEGGIVAYATETFYGLGCCALDAKAIASIFIAKRRLSTMPLPVIIGNIEQLSMLTDSISPMEEALMQRFWPAPLSILFRARPEVPSILTGGTGMLAVRLSPHEGAIKLACAAGFPLVATSANISGRQAVTQAKDLDVELLSGIAGYYDDGPSPQGGLPSTLVCCERGGHCKQGALRIVRHGSLNAELLKDAGFCIL